MFEEMTKTINRVNPKWSKDYIIRFLYVKLAPFFERDLEYFLKSPEEQYQEYKNGFVNRVPKVVCSTFADFYVDLFASFGIKVKKIIANKNKIPLFALIVEDDNGWYYLDPLNDLFRNQYGLDTNYFAHVPSINKTITNDYPFLTDLTPEYISKIDCELNLYPYNMSLSTVFEVLRHEMLKTCKLAKELGISRKDIVTLAEIKFLIASEHLINLGCVPGALERLQLYEYLRKTLLNSLEKKHTFIKLGPNKNVNVDFYNPLIGSMTIYEERRENGFYSLVRKKEEFTFPLPS